MDFASFVFYILAAMTVFAGVMVISARNPVHSVLFLIFAFFNAAGLFLFVVMMLNINIVELRQGFLRYLPLGILIAAVLLWELYMVLQAGVNISTVTSAAMHPIPPADKVTNTQALGAILYTDFVLIF